MPREVFDPPVPSPQQLLPLLVHPVLVTVKLCWHEQVPVQLAIGVAFDVNV